MISTCNFENFDGFAFDLKLWRGPSAHRVTFEDSKSTQFASWRLAIFGSAQCSDKFMKMEAKESKFFATQRSYIPTFSKSNNLERSPQGGSTAVEWQKEDRPLLC